MPQDYFIVFSQASDILLHRENWKRAALALFSGAAAFFFSKDLAPPAPRW